VSTARWAYVTYVHFSLQKDERALLWNFLVAKLSSSRTAPHLFLAIIKIRVLLSAHSFWLSVPLYYCSNTASNSATWTVLTFRYSAICQERVYFSYDCHNQRPSLPSTSSTCWSCENAACSLRAIN